MRPYAAVIFDMDGVIVDSEPLHEKAFQVVFEEMGYGQTHGFHFPDYYGRSDKALWLDFITRHSPPTLRRADGLETGSLHDLAGSRPTHLLADPGPGV